MKLIAQIIEIHFFKNSALTVVDLNSVTCPICSSARDAPRELTQLPLELKN
jgi:hypothetical protein